MEQVSRHFSRSFHDASVFCSSLEHAMPRASAPFSAEYSPLISVAYTWIHKDHCSSSSGQWITGWHIAYLLACATDNHVISWFDERSKP